jgi:transcriptional regulator with XRE-family HTH domain
MPRRRRPDPVALRVGARIRQLREEAGLTLEKLAYESDVGSKGFVSDIERGLARPSLATLRSLADHLGLALLDLVTFPEQDVRQAVIDGTRFVSPETLRRWLAEVPPPPTRKRATRRR